MASWWVSQAFFYSMAWLTHQLLLLAVHKYIMIIIFIITEQQERKYAHLPLKLKIIIVMMIT